MTESHGRRPALFLDRDGTLLRDTGPLPAFHKALLLPGVVEALRMVTRLGYPVLLVTNQGWVATGRITFREADEATGGLARHLRRAGVAVLDYAFCPHHPRVTTGPYGGPCACRKPEPGLLLRLARRHAIDLGRSLMVGDSLVDVEAGRRAGTHAALVLTGEGSRHRAHVPDDVWVLTSVADLPARLGENGAGSFGKRKAGLRKSPASPT